VEAERVESIARVGPTLPTHPANTTLNLSPTMDSDDFFSLNDDTIITQIPRDDAAEGSSNSREEINV